MIGYPVKTKIEMFHTSEGIVFKNLKRFRKTAVVRVWSRICRFAEANETGIMEGCLKEFHLKHEKLYTFSLPWVPVEFRNLRLIARVPGKKIEVKKIDTGTRDPSEALKRKRLCYFNSNYIETSVYDSDKLKAGNIIPGPAVIEVPTTTAVIPGGFQCRIDEYGNYIITRRK